MAQEPYRIIKSEGTWSFYSNAKGLFLITQELWKHFNEIPCYIAILKRFATFLTLCARVLLLK